MLRLTKESCLADKKIRFMQLILTEVIRLTQKNEVQVVVILSAIWKFTRKYQIVQQIPVNLGPNSPKSVPCLPSGRKLRIMATITP